jgi:hypothetical protein
MGDEHARSSFANRAARLARELRALADLQRETAHAAGWACEFGQPIHAPPWDLSRLRLLASQHRLYCEWLGHMVPVALAPRGGSGAAVVVITRARVVFASRRGWRPVLAALGDAEREIDAFIRESTLLEELRGEAHAGTIAAMLETSTEAAGWLVPAPGPSDGA